MEPNYSQDEENLQCPLCLEDLDITDKSFLPCQCGYQMCRLCWHHIKEDLNGRCPNCRQLYDPENYKFNPPDPEEILRIANQKKNKERLKKHQDASARKQLANVRVIQRNLVYVTNLSLSVAKEENLWKFEYFGQYGKIIKIVVNRNNVYHTPSGPSVSAYITFAKGEDAKQAILAADGATLDGRVIRASFGTTKYCSYFLRNVPCPNPECMYLHDLGSEEDSFTKEDMAAGNLKHHLRDQYRLSLTNPLPPGSKTALPPPRQKTNPNYLSPSPVSKPKSSKQSWKTMSADSIPYHEDVTGVSEPHPSLAYDRLEETSLRPTKNKKKEIKKNEIPTNHVKNTLSSPNTIKDVESNLKDTKRKETSLAANKKSNPVVIPNKVSPRDTQIHLSQKQKEVPPTLKNSPNPPPPSKTIVSSTKQHSQNNTTSNTTESNVKIPIPSSPVIETQSLREPLLNSSSSSIAEMDNPGLLESLEQDDLDVPSQTTGEGVQPSIEPWMLTSSEDSLFYLSLDDPLVTSPASIKGNISKDGALPSGISFTSTIQNPRVKSRFVFAQSDDPLPNRPLSHSSHWPSKGVRQQSNEEIQNSLRVLFPNANVNFSTDSRWHGRDASVTSVPPPSSLSLSNDFLNDTKNSRASLWGNPNQQSQKTFNQPLHHSTSSIQPGLYGEDSSLWNVKQATYQNRPVYANDFPQQSNSRFSSGYQAPNNNSYPFWANSQNSNITHGTNINNFYQFNSSVAPPPGFHYQTLADSY